MVSLHTNKTLPRHRVSCPYENTNNNNNKNVLLLSLSIHSYILSKLKSCVNFLLKYSQDFSAFSNSSKG